MTPETWGGLGILVTAMLGGAGKLILNRRKRNGNGSGLTLALMKHIDERAEHKARGAVSAVTLETSLLRRDLSEFKSEASGRFDGMEEKVDTLSTDVADLRGYLRGKLGE